ncbi:MAG: hypothetical protein FWF79_05975 [Defluviitaleaceae bacterium]|nr:hypothetical protein [Defluviitaleaceae bacterium]
MSNMVVRTNVFALNAHRNMKNVGLEQGRASNRLSSGFRINSAADDAAGLAISENMRAQIRGLDQASRNAQDGQAMLLTTEGGLEEIGNMLQRTRELLVQASNDTNTQDQRTMIEQEIQQLATEIASMQQRVEFNTNRVLAMGPALDVEISQHIAKIDGNNLILNAIAGALNENRSAVADAREMLALFNNTDTWASLSENTRLETVVREALGAVDMGIGALRANAGVPAHVDWQTDIGGRTLLDVASIVPGTPAVTGSPLNPVTMAPWASGTTAVTGTFVHVDASGNVLDSAAVYTRYASTDSTGVSGGPTAGYLTYVNANSGTPGNAAFTAINILSTHSVTDLVGMLNNRDTQIMNALGQVASIRTEMVLAGRGIVTGRGFDNSVADFRAETSSGNFVAFFQVGANANQGISYDFENVSRAVSAAAATVSTIAALVATPSAGSGIGSGADVTEMIGWLQTSLDDVNTVRANLGAVQNRMDFTMRSLDISSENLQDSESRVRNADIAREMMRFTMSNVLQQAAVSMLAQANQLPQNLLQLLR